MTDVLYGNVRIVVNHGCVIYTDNGRILKPFIHKGGYLVIDLHKQCKRKHFYIHRLVAGAFLCNPEHKTCVDHIDNCPANNAVHNLRWATYQENCTNVGLKSQNTSGTKGVCWHKQRKKWQARI